MKKWLALIFVAVILSITILIIHQMNRLELSYSQKQKIVIEAGKLLEKIWTEGDVKKNWFSGKFVCNELLGSPQNVHHEYTRCNPSFLECVFNNSDIFSLEIDKVKYLIQLNKFENGKFIKIVSKQVTHNSNHPYYGVALNVSLKGDSDFGQLIMFEDSCHETYLPQRLYAQGPDIFKGEDLDWRWDNIGRNIFVDKHQVTVRDYLEWKETLNLPIDEALKKQDKSAAVVNQSIDDMKSFCAFRGKQLLKAEVFDAASFYPSDLSNPLPLRNVRGPYPWSTRKDDSFLNSAQKDVNFVFDPVYCSKVFTNECVQTAKYQKFNSLSPSWSGIYEVLGGNLEYLTNVAFPDQNLKASSYFFKANSYWHQIGARAFWDGQGLDHLNNFDWKKMDGVDQSLPVQIGFRCMRTL